MVKITDFPGCCAAKIFYDLGSVHNVRSEPNQDAFDKVTIEARGSYVNIAITSSYQAKENEYLRTQGWDMVRVGHLYVWTLSNNQRNNYLTTKRERVRKEAEEARKAALELGKNPKVTLEYIHAVMANGGLTGPKRNIIENMYKVKIPRDLYMTHDSHRVFNTVKSLVALKKREMDVSKAIAA